jgi:hypothetical protein
MYVEGECINKKQAVFLVNQGKFKVGVVPADRLGCLLQKYIFVIMEGVQSLACQLGLTP